MLIAEDEKKAGGLEHSCGDSVRGKSCLPREPKVSLEPLSLSKRLLEGDLASCMS